MHIRPGERLTPEYWEHSIDSTYGSDYSPILSWFLFNILCLEKKKKKIGLRRFSVSTQLLCYLSLETQQEKKGFVTHSIATSLTWLFWDAQLSEKHGGID